VIGRRRLDTHFAGLRELGIEVQTGTEFVLTRRRLRGADVLLDEASVTATENIVMAACLAEGTTTLFHAACEPHVQDLCELLNAMGASIDGVGTNRLRVRGTDRLHGAEYRVSPDYVDMGSFLIAAAVTGGDMTVPGLGDDPAVRVLQRSLQKLGVRWRRDGEDLVLPAGQDLRVKPDLGAAIPKIEDGVWPAFPSDMMSAAVVAATQARGSILFFEKLFESRMYFVDRLIEMGAQIVQCDPHRIVVQGPSRLHAIHMTSPDIRAGMAMVIAALCADGESVIEHARMIDRGYQRVDERLREMGADVERST
jgi:UDP-N-acetylglucosamine 1-carboxyvinyltransferase